MYITKETKMTNEDFDKIVEERIEQIKTVLTAKAQEYATNDDRLHNFKVAARIDNTTPAKALWGMALKHLVSITDMIESDKKYPQKVVDEKCGDMINYLILLEALFIEHPIT